MQCKKLALHQNIRLAWLGNWKWMPPIDAAGNLSTEYRLHRCIIESRARRCGLYNISMFLWLQSLTTINDIQTEEYTFSGTLIALLFIYFFYLLFLFRLIWFVIIARGFSLLQNKIIKLIGNRQFLGKNTYFYRFSCRISRNSFGVFNLRWKKWISMRYNMKTQDEMHG